MRMYLGCLQPSARWCTAAPLCALALLLAPLPLSEITVLSYRSVEFSSRTLPPLSHSLSGGPEKGSVFSPQVYPRVRFSSRSTFTGGTKELLIARSERFAMLTQISILSFYKLDVQITRKRLLDTWMFICVFPLF